jgi:acyl-CoA thioesterase I
MAVPGSLRGVRRIVCLGDSITEAGEEPGGYVDLVRKALADADGRSIEVVNAGIGGHKSSDMLGRFQRDVVAQRPDLVTISCGINDVWHGFDEFHPDGGGPKSVPLPAYRKNVQAMVEAAQGERILPVLLSTTIIGEDPHSPGNRLLRDYNEVLRHIAGLAGCRFIDLMTPFLDAVEAARAENPALGLALTTDGVHLNDAGNRLMAETVLAGLG